MFRSATFRLTCWYLGIVMAICIMFSAVIYRVSTDELSSGLNHQTARIYNQFPVFENDPLLHSSKDYDYGAHRLLLRLIIVNLVMLGAAGYASYWLARRTLDPIRDAHEQQKRFTADVSHELRTPITAIRMESEVALIDKKASAAELRKALSSNVEETTKLEALINNLLRLTRLEADELQQNFTLLSSEVIAGEAIDEVSKLAKAKNITLLNKTQDLPVNGDHDSLVQLLVILLDNAIKYSPKNSGVTITTKRTEKSVTIAVNDRGSGIEREALEHVFDRFYRADSSRNKTDSEGFGLGLSIAKMIADMHDATITISSRPDHGTSALVILPTSPH